MDATETATGYEVVAEPPGSPKEAVRVSVSGRVLRIEAERERAIPSL